MTDRTPIREALEQAEQILRSLRTSKPGPIEDAADVIRRLLDDYEITATRDESFVSVPVAELEALRNSALAHGPDMRIPRRTLEALVARIPEPPPWEPSDEQMRVALTEFDNADDARRVLIAMHAAGLLREDHDHE